jgi:hypothetical protein
VEPAIITVSQVYLDVAVVTVVTVLRILAQVEVTSDSMTLDVVST